MAFFCWNNLSPSFFFKRLVGLAVRIRLSLLVRIARCPGGFLLEAAGSRLLGLRLDQWARHVRTVRVL